MKNITEDINNCAQNHPTLIAMDLCGKVPFTEVLRVLKFRGINKWLRVRRLLIQLKIRWKDEINELEKRRREAKQNRDWLLAAELKGRKEMLSDCRQQIRALCHSPRDVDFPLSVRDFGDACKLPADFPRRPHKKWFWRH